MKTKHILTAMVLPTLLAACTADEIVENNNNNLVAQGRAEVEAVSFAIDGEGSRLAYNDDNLGWDWENTDKFLLFPADNGEAPYVGTKANPAYPGQRFTVGNNLVSGYEYEKNANGGYTTKAAVMGEGLYWGYAPSFNKTTRGLIEFNLATSQDIEYYKSEAAQAFVTPLYEVNAEVYNNKLPLEMINWYTTAIFPLTNNTKQDLNLKQIVVKSDDPFLVKGEIDIAEMGAYIMAYDGEKWDAKQNYDTDKTNNLDLEEGEFIDGFRKEYMAKKGENGLESNLLLLNLEGEVLEAGETKTYYMLLPATEGEIDCSIVIMTEEGYVEITSTSQSNYLKDTQVYHNGQKAAFGWQTVKNESVAKPYVIKTSELIDSEYNTYYIASYNDLMKLINSVNGTFTVWNVGDWAVDAKMAKAITDSDSEIIFRGGVVIEDTEEVELNKVTFRANLTVKEGTKVTFVEDVNDTNNKQWGTITVEKDAELVVKDCQLGGVIIVEEGATLSVTKDANAYAYVQNYGNVTLEEQTMVTVDQQGGTLNLNKNEKTTKEVEYSADYIVFPEGVTFETVIAKGVKLNVSKEITLDRDDTKSTKATLTVNGNVELNANVNIKGVMTIEGDTEDVNGDLIVEADGELTNAGYVKSDIIVEESGTVYNNGTARDIYNNGLVVAGKGSKSTIVEGDGRVDNSKGGAVTNTAGQDVYYLMKNGNVDDIESVTFAKWSINTLRIEGELDLDRPLDEKYWEQLKSLNTLEITDRTKIYVDGDVHVSFGSVKLEGNAVVNGYKYETSKLTFDNAVEITMMNKSVKSGDSRYCLDISDVTISGKGEVKFKTEDEKQVTGHKKYNKPVIDTEDASLKAEIDETEIVINGNGYTRIDVVGTLAELKTALGGDEETIYLHNSVIELDEELVVERNVKIQGGTLYGRSVRVGKNANVTFENVTFHNAANDKKNASALYYANGESKLVVTGCTFNGFEWDAIQVTNMTESADVRILNNVFKTPVSENAKKDGSYVHVANKTKNGYIKISGNTFGADNMTDYLVKVYGFNSNDVVIGKNTFAGGYTEGSVMFCRETNYNTENTFKVWTNETIYNAMTGSKNVSLGSLRDQLDEEHKQEVEL